MVLLSARWAKLLGSHAQVGSREAVRDHGMFGDVDRTSGRLRNFFSAPPFFCWKELRRDRAYDK